jgi:hypothetical protein
VTKSIEQIGVPYNVYGIFQSTLRYTPEKGFKGGSFLQLEGTFPQMPQGLNLKFGGVWQEYDQLFATPFDYPEKRSFGNGAKMRLTARLTGSIVPGSLPLDISMGEVPFSYSPYTINMTYPLIGNRNSIRKGVFLDSLRHQKGNVSSFIVWDGGPKNIVWGGRDVSQFGKVTLTNIIVNSQRGITSVIEDKVYSCEIRYLNDLLQTDLICARNWRSEDGEGDFADLILFEGDYKWNPKASFFLIYRDFGYKSPQVRFDPAYRSALDYNIYDNRLEAPIDLYMGLKGYSMGVKARLDQLSFRFGQGNYYDMKTINSQTSVPSMINILEFDGNLNYGGVSIKSSMEFRERTHFLVLGQDNTDNIYDCTAESPSESFKHLV